MMTIALSHRTPNRVRGIVLPPPLTQSGIRVPDMSESPEATESPMAGVVDVYPQIFDR